MDFIDHADLLRIDGRDSVTFAQAQFCGDVATLAQGTWQWNAWLDAKGRVRQFFALLCPAPERLFAWLPARAAEPMRAALAPYVLRSKVALEALEGWALHAESSEAPAPPPGRFEDREGRLLLRLPGDPARVAVLAEHREGAPAPDATNAWRRADVDARLPWLAPELSGEFLAQSLDLEALGALSFGKGCYPGQEVVARLHFRGGNKRHLHRLLASTPAPPASGERILRCADSSPVGRVLHAARNRAADSVLLAVLEADSAASDLCLDNGIALRVLA
jgi:folate-binding protein YgfZ